MEPLFLLTIYEKNSVLIIRFEIFLLLLVAKTFRNLWETDPGPITGLSPNKLKERKIPRKKKYWKASMEH